MAAAGEDALTAGVGRAEDEDGALLTPTDAGDSGSTDADTACCCGEPLRLFVSALSEPWEEVKARRGSDALTAGGERCARAGGISTAIALPLSLLHAA